MIFIIILVAALGANRKNQLIPGMSCSKLGILFSIWVRENYSVGNGHY